MTIIGCFIKQNKCGESVKLYEINGGFNVVVACANKIIYATITDSKLLDDILAIEPSCATEKIGNVYEAVRYIIRRTKELSEFSDEVKSNKTLNTNFQTEIIKLVHDLIECLNKGIKVLYTIHTLDSEKSTKYVFSLTLLENGKHRLRAIRFKDNVSTICNRLADVNTVTAVSKLTESSVTEDYTTIFNKIYN